MNPIRGVRSAMAHTPSLGVIDVNKLECIGGPDRSTPENSLAAEELGRSSPLSITESSQIPTQKFPWVMETTRDHTASDSPALLEASMIIHTQDNSVPEPIYPPTLLPYSEDPAFTTTLVPEEITKQHRPARAHDLE